MTLVPILSPVVGAVASSALSEGVGGPLAAPAIADQAMSFGRLTLAGAGGTALVNTGGGSISSASIDSGTDADHWQVSSSGVFSPSATGVSEGLSASYTLGVTYTNSEGSDSATLTINTEANTYSAATGNLAAILALGSGTIDGKTVKGRPGADICGATVGDSVTFPAASTYTTGLTVTSHDTNNPCYLRRADFRNNGIVTLADVIVRDSFEDGVDSHDNTALLQFLQNSPQVTLTRVTGYSDDVELEDHAGGTVTALKITKSGGATAVKLSATDSSFHDYSRAITLDGIAHLHIENCDFDRSVSDHISVAVDGTETHFEILRNRFYSVWGRGSDPQNPHCDAIQINQGPMTQDNATPYTIVGNIVFPKGGRSHAVQAIFIENTPSNRRTLATIEHNLILSTARNGITIERPATGTTIRGNTVLFDQNTNTEDNELPPFISTISATYPTDDLSGVIVQYNLTCDVDYLNATVSNNHEFGTSAGANDNTDYAALLTGTDFDSDNMADLAAFKTAMTPDGNTTLWPPAGVRIGALGGYYDYDTGVSTAPWDSSGFLLESGDDLLLESGSRILLEA